MNNRWCIYIDIEGFSSIYRQDSRRAETLLGYLVEAIWLVGSKVFHNLEDRLFIHQYGDGFAIVSDHHERDLNRAVNIGVFIMQRILILGGVARAGLSEGEYGDILGMYPHSIENEAARIFQETGCSGGLSVGRGIMNINQTMGSSFINSVSVGKAKRKGPLFLTNAVLQNRLHLEDSTLVHASNGISEINWLQYSSDGLDAIFLKTGIEKPSIDDLSRTLRRYLENEKISLRWKFNAHKLMN